ncbi:MAG: tetratricopeptide repeat protein [bacterium]
MFYSTLCPGNSFLLRLLSQLTLILFFIFPVACSYAARPDSVKLFSGLRSPDERVKLKTLQKIYTEYYSFYPVAGHPYVLQTIRLAQKLGDKEAEASAFYSLGFYFQCRELSDSALYCYQVGFDLSKLIGSTLLLARGYGDLGDLYRLRGDKIKALEYLNKSISLDSTSNGHYAGTCYSLGILYSDAGIIDLSTYYLLKALKIKEEQGKLVDAGYLACNLAGTYMQSTTKEDGMRYYDRALEYFRMSNFSKGESYVYNALGQMYFGNKDYQKAMVYFRKALALSLLDTITVRSGHSFILTNIGDAWMGLNRYDSAQFYYSRSLSFCDSSKDFLPMACTYLSLGELNTRLKKYPLAIEFLNKGLFYSKIVNYRAQWEKAYNLLSECYNASGNIEKALNYLKKRNEIKDSIFTEKAHQDVVNMMIKYETRKKDEQISALGSDKKRQEERTSRAVGFIHVIIVLVLTAGIIIWIYYRRHLQPKVKTLDFIQAKISLEKEGDNRKLKALKKVLPPELKPFTSNPPPAKEFKTELIQQLESLLSRDKIFLNENLTLAETARKLGTNTSYLSRLINEHYNVNFSSFLNKYRIEEAKKMILDDHFKNFSMEGIAKNAGFRSKSTFNQVFKSITGLTPTDFGEKKGKARV